MTVVYSTVDLEELFTGLRNAPGDVIMLIKLVLEIGELEFKRLHLPASVYQQHAIELHYGKCRIKCLWSLMVRTKSQGSPVSAPSMLTILTLNVLKL